MKRRKQRDSKAMRNMPLYEARESVEQTLGMDLMKRFFVIADYQDYSDTVLRTYLQSYDFSNKLL